MSSSDKENEEESSESMEEEESPESMEEEESLESMEEEESPESMEEQEIPESMEEEESPESMEEEEESPEEEEDEEDWVTVMTNGAEKLELYWKELCNQTAVPLVKRFYMYDKCVELLKILQTVDPESKSARNAMYHYLAGRIIDALPDYNDIAEMHLLRALIINPRHSDTWRCLANSYAKKGNRIVAKICIETALKRLRRPEKGALCKMSLLAAWIAQDDVNGGELIAESIKRAHEANDLDNTDGYCWYALGRAYQCYFLQTGEWDLHNLQFASNAYVEANKDEERKIFYTDLIYQWALVDTALENYERALMGFALSVQSNPALDGTKDMNMMIRLLDKLDMLLKLGIRSTIRELMKDAAKFDDPAIFQVSPSYEEVTVMDLLPGGHNEGFAVLAKVLYPVYNDKVYPLYYVLCDTNLDSFILTVHGIRKMAIKRGDVITLLDPYYRLVNFDWQEKLYKFKSVRVNLPAQVLVNGEAVPDHLVIRRPLGRKPKRWGL